MNYARDSTNKIYIAIKMHQTTRIGEDASSSHAYGKLNHEA